jgi:hypothetical protein
VRGEGKREGISRCTIHAPEPCRHLNMHKQAWNHAGNMTENEQVVYLCLLHCRPTHTGPRPSCHTSVVAWLSQAQVMPCPP